MPSALRGPIAAIVAVLITLPAPGAEQLSLPDVLVAPGAGPRSIFVHCTHATALSAYSLGLRYRPQDLRVLEISTAGTSVEGLDFWKGMHDPVKGEIVWGAVIDLDLETFLQPGAGHTLARLEVEVLLPQGSKTAIELIDGLGAYPVENSLVDPLGMDLPLVLRSGSLEVAVPPVAEAGVARELPEGSTLLLDGSASRSPQGRPLSFRWRQVSGPAAAPEGSLEAARVSFVLPQIPGAEAQLVFELEVTDGVAPSTDRVAVTVTAVEDEPGFIRGDVNRNARIDLGDPVLIVLFLFNGEEVTCLDAADADDSGDLDISDSIRILGFLFFSEGPLAPPAAAAGADPTGDALDCRF